MFWTGLIPVRPLVEPTDIKPLALFLSASFMTINEIQSAMSDCMEKAIISSDGDALCSIISYHHALAIAEAMMLDEIDSIPSM